LSLGRDLFFDPRLSADDMVSCARCHQPALYGTDALPRSRGVHDKLNPRNAPTVLNAGLETGAHWRDERKDLEDQATQSFIGPASFDNPDYAAVRGRIKAIAGYAPLFRAAFPGVADPVTSEALDRAIGVFERTLVTPAPFDDFLACDDTALTPAQQTGLKTFIQTGPSPAKTASMSAVARRPTRWPSRSGPRPQARGPNPTRRGASLRSVAVGCGAQGGSSSAACCGRV
jgi:cytochrome c peroxidase